MSNELLIISGPSGIGKSTLIKDLRPYGFEPAISTTTRAPRNNEIPGVDYEFTDRETFSEDVSKEEFEWQNEIFGNTYGYKKRNIRKIREQNAVPVVTIYTPYVEDFKQSFPEAKSVYLLPKDVSFLANRLRTRKQTPEEFAYRLDKAVEDVELYKSQYEEVFDKEIVISSDNNIPVIEDIRKLYPKGHTQTFRFL